MGLTLALSPGLTWANEPPPESSSSGEAVAAAELEPTPADSSTEPPSEDVPESSTSQDPELADPATDANGQASDLGALSATAADGTPDAGVAPDASPDEGIVPFADNPPLACSVGTTGSNWLINQASTKVSEGVYTNRIEWVDPSDGVKTTIATLSDTARYRDNAITRETNALGISVDGKYIYLVDFNIDPADNPSPKVYQYDVVLDEINSFSAANDSNPTSPARDNYRTRRGGVDLNTGIYYYSTSTLTSSVDPGEAKTHYLYALDPGSGVSWYVGKVNTQHSGESGDLAFDSQGNMYFVVGSNNLAYVNVYSGQLPTDPNAPKIDITLSFLNQVGDTGSNTGNGVGIAYGPDGYLYVSNTAGGLYRVDPSTGAFTSAGGVLGGGGATVDLGTCVPPSTLTIKKAYPSGRSEAADQVTLSARRNNTQIGQPATTDGPAVGMQTNQMGPLPILTGNSFTYVIRETATGGTASFTPYSTTYRCVDTKDAAWPVVSGDIATEGSQREFTLGEVLVPTGHVARAIECTFTNIPHANVQVDKLWVVNGTTHNHGQQPEGLEASLTMDPAGSTSGAPQWGQVRERFFQGDEVMIGENTTITKDGCSLTGSTISGDGIAGTVDLGIDGKTVTLPGVENRYVITNTVACQTLTLVKQVENNHGGSLTGADWDGGLFAKVGDDSLTFDSGETKAVEPGEFVLSEDDKDGYELSSLTCDGGPLDGKTVTIGIGDEVICIFVNRDVPGSVVWTKVDKQTPAQLLSGSEWRLTGPAGPNSQQVSITDCVADSAENCPGPDKDPNAGSFRLEGLAWGDYTLEETKAPPGYKPAGEPITFPVGAADLDVDLGAIENVQRKGPPLPLTGGFGRDHVYLAGAFALLLSAAAYGTVRVRGRRNPHGA